MKLCCFALAAVMAGCSFAGLDELAEKIKNAQDELQTLVSATKVGTKWYLSSAQYDAVTNRLHDLTKRTNEYVEELNKTESGRKVAHGSVTGQNVDLAKGRCVTTYADGFAVTNRFKEKRVETIQERTERLVRAAEKAAQKAKEGEAKRRAQLPEDYRRTLDRRDAASATTNEITAVLTQ